MIFFIVIFVVLFHLLWGRVLIFNRGFILKIIDNRVILLSCMPRNIYIYLILPIFWYLKLDLLHAVRQMWFCRGELPYLCVPLCGRKAPAKIWRITHGTTAQGEHLHQSKNLAFCLLVNWPWVASQWSLVWPPLGPQEVCFAWSLTSGLHGISWDACKLAWRPLCYKKTDLFVHLHICTGLQNFYTNSFPGDHRIYQQPWLLSSHNFSDVHIAIIY